MSPGSPASPAAWHADRQALSRYVVDLIADEVAHLRPGGAALPAPPWLPGLALDEQGLGLDSLERLSVASALNEALHMHESGVEDLLLARPHFGGWLELAAAALAEFDTRLTFRTSGSSGGARACKHDLATLQQEVTHLVDLTAGARRVLSAVPAHHIYGFLFTVLLPQRHGQVEVIDVRRLTPQALASMSKPGDLLISHPAHWTLMARHVDRLPAGVHGITSTAPCPDELARHLEAIGLSQLTQIYGSSETAGIGTKAAAGSPFRLMPFWSRDESGNHLLRSAPDGSTRSHAIADRLDWADDRRFSVGPRLDQAVQVGGVNVFPARVRQVLQEHPLVADAAVRLMTPEEGSRLKAFVVLAPGADKVATERALWPWAEARLAAPERPKSFTFGERLPSSALGKLADWPLLVSASNDACSALS